MLAQTVRAALVVTLIGALTVAAVAQEPSVQQTAIPAPGSSRLKIAVLLGRNAVNDPVGRVGTSPVIEVRDDNDRPIEGATVIFDVPAQGPGGVFSTNTITFTTRTNSEGQATARFLPNGIAGRFNIHATVTVGDRFGDVLIPQTNSSVSIEAQKNKSFVSRNKWWIIGGAAAVALTVGIALARGSSGNSPQNAPPAVTVTLGVPVFGGR